MKLGFLLLLIVLLTESTLILEFPVGCVIFMFHFIYVYLFPFFVLGKIVHWIIRDQRRGPYHPKWNREAILKDCFGNCIAFAMNSTDWPYPFLRSLWKLYCTCNELTGLTLSFDWVEHSPKWKHFKNHFYFSGFFFFFFLRRFYFSILSLITITLLKRW